MSRSRPLVVLWLLGAAMCALPTAAVEARTISVPQDLPTLSAGVRASAPGDTILLAPGRYGPSSGEELPIEFAGADVWVLGAGADQTLIDGEGRAAILVFSDGDASHVRDVRLHRGFAAEGGACVRIRDASPVLAGLAVTEGDGRGNGDAVQVDGGSPIFRNCLLTGGREGPTVVIREGEPEFTNLTVARNCGPAFELSGRSRTTLRSTVVAEPGEPFGRAVGLEVAAAGARPILVDVHWDCRDESIRFVESMTREQEHLVARARRANGLNATIPGFVDTAAGDFRLVAPNRLANAEGVIPGAFGGEIPLNFSPEVAPIASREPTSTGTSLLEPTVPNPVTLSTSVRFHLAKGSVVDLAVYNVLGQRVRTLFAGDLPAGDHTREWDGRDELGEELPQGMYFVRITQGAITESQRVVLLR
ncbi:MAG: FlgD immunoglobulin-like domain containing protein [bacterium]